MQIANIPPKYYVPFAMNDAAKVAIPITTADATRASLSLGFPPLTGQPPEAGGVPPQLEDFNGAINQIAAVAWWLMAGGPFPYDSAFASSTYINGYPMGAVVESSDNQGAWLSTMDGNQNNPDTVGTGWVPAYAYGSTVLGGLTGGTVTLSPLQAAKATLAFYGALTSNLMIVVPNWFSYWEIYNNTTGAFTLTVKTASGSGVTIPQNGSPTRVRGTGTDVLELPENIAPATAPTHALQQQQAFGFGQTLQDVTGSRSAGTTYTNSTNKPIVVYVQSAASTSSGQYIVITLTAPVSISVAECIASAAGEGLFVNAVIPVGASYEVQVFGTTVNTWAEYR